MNTARIGRLVTVLFLAVAACLLVAWWGWQRQLLLVSEKARPFVSRVIYAYHISQITGGYWENEMVAQYNAVKRLPQSDRLSFFKGMVLNCPLDTCRAMTFYDQLGDDASALHVDLVRLRDGKMFTRLTNRQQQEVTAWIVELETIATLATEDGHIKANETPMK